MAIAAVAHAIATMTPPSRRRADIELVSDIFVPVADREIALSRQEYHRTKETWAGEVAPVSCAAFHLSDAAPGQQEQTLPCDDGLGCR